MKTNVVFRVMMCKGKVRETDIDGCCNPPMIKYITGIILCYHNIIPVIITKYCYCYTNMHARTITIILACIHVRYGKYT